MGGGYLSQLGSRLATPADGLSWTQLAAATIFILAVIVAWRQVVNMTMREISGL